MLSFEPGQVWQDKQGSWWTILAVWEDRYGRVSVEAQYSRYLGLNHMVYGSIVYFDGNGVSRQPSGDIKLSMMITG